MMAILLKTVNFLTADGLKHLDLLHLSVISNRLSIEEETTENPS